MDTNIVLDKNAKLYHNANKLGDVMIQNIAFVSWRDSGGFLGFDEKKNPMWQCANGSTSNSWE